MTLVAVTQRVVVDGPYHERRDSLDQRWYGLLHACGLTAMPIPNDARHTQALIAAAPIGGVILTGGNDLASVGGDAPERDATEKQLVAWAIERRLPVLGVCRGMQLLQEYFGIGLAQVEGHVAECQEITLRGERITVNSYHRWGAKATPDAFECVGQADDGVIKAMEHKTLPIHTIMWHPERMNPYSERDISWIRRIMKVPA